MAVINPENYKMKPDSKDENKLKLRDLKQVFLADRLLPNATASFLSRLEAMEDALKTADVVLDTNALLIPYKAGAGSLKDIVKILGILKKQNRVFMPAQVAREFIKNRPSKIAELQQGIADKISQIPTSEKLSYPILEGITNYDEINAHIDQLRELRKKILAEKSALLETVSSWEWNDPVIAAYRDVFTDELIIELSDAKDKLAEELSERYELLIPPGYKDAGKEDGGVGDFLIWKTMLSLGGKNKKSMIFVSGDEKPDWQHRTSGGGFLPRYELVDEYRRISGGKGFYIIQLSRLVELLAGDAASVEEIKKVESQKKAERESEEEILEVATCPYCNMSQFIPLAKPIGSSGICHCLNCKGVSHIHRVSGGVKINRAFEKSRSRISSFGSEVIRCPQCASGVIINVDEAEGSGALCQCGFCDTEFSVVRRKDGSAQIV